MIEKFKKFLSKRKNEATRQEWNPHWSVKLAGGALSGVAGVIKVILWAVATVLLIGLVCGFVFAGILGNYLQTDILPYAVEDLDGYELDQTSYLYYIDSDGDIQELQRIYTTTDRRWATIDEIPQDLINAAVAIEDRRFYEHQGVDWITTVKACANMFVGSSSTFGGSTITQQLIKNLTGDDDVTVQRKLIEIFKAIQFEKQYDKDVVMEWYLNTIYFGYSKYGVRAAAEQYFGKEVELLNTAECAALISITNNPSMFNPFSQNKYEYKDYGMTLGKDRNRIRQVNTLWTMRNEGYLTEEEYQEAYDYPMEFKTGISEQDRLAHCSNEGCGYYGTVGTFLVEEETGNFYTCPSCGTHAEIDTSASQDVYSWFTEAAMEDVCIDLAALDGLDWNTLNKDIRETYREKLKIGGYHIYTTLDMDVQKELDAIYTDLSKIPTTKSTQQLSSAMVIVDNKTGDIVALAGNVGPKTEFDSLSYATEAKLQTGSTQKPLSVYAPAFEAGIITPASVVKDMPMAYYSGTPFPRNDNRQYNYARSIYSGVVRSVNAISVNTLKALGLENSYKFAKEKFRLQGLTDSYITSSGSVLSDVDYSPLGMGALTTGVTVRDMASAYATFANGGVWREGRTYTKVYDSQGNLVLDNTQEFEQILSEKSVNYMNYCLTAAVEGGTGTAAQISGQIVAGKTGTTSSNRDRWFCGFTPYYTAAVWCGFDQPEQIKLTGSTANPAARLWRKVLQPLHVGLANGALFDGSGFGGYSICLDTGMIATAACSKDVRGGEHTSYASCYPEDISGKYCDKHVLVDYCVTGGGVATEYCRKFPDVKISEVSLVKRSADEIAELKRAKSCGLQPEPTLDSYVWYTEGNWHGFGGKAQPDVSAPYIVCPVHTKEAWDKKEQADKEKEEEGTGETTASYYFDFNKKDI